jgi:MFS family permease
VPTPSARGVRPSGAFAPLTQPLSRHHASRSLRAARAASHSEAPAFEGEDEEEAVEELSALVTSCASLGQIIGPLGGAFLVSTFGFRGTCDWLSLLFGLDIVWLWWLSARGRPVRAALAGRPHTD